MTVNLSLKKRIEKSRPRLSSQRTSLTKKSSLSRRKRKRFLELMPSRQSLSEAASVEAAEVQEEEQEEADLAQVLHPVDLWQHSEGHQHPPLSSQWKRKRR